MNKKPQTFNFKNSILGAVILLAILVGVNYLFNKINNSLDLTHDKRYTLHDKTKSLLKSIKNDINITLYLTGDDLQKGLKKLSIKSEETLGQFRELSKNKITYQVVDPMKSDSTVMKELYEQKIVGFPVTVPVGKGATKQIQVFPWAIVSNGVHKIPVMLQEYSSPKLSNTDLNNSEILLEYKFASAIKSLERSIPDTVLYLTGNGQPQDYQVYDMANEISRQYVFEAIPLQELQTIPQKYKLVLIQKPSVPFSEVDKWKIDQYLMNGGNLIMSIDGAKASMDSLFRNGSFVAMANDINVSDMLFQYGLRLNVNILSDAERHIDIPLQSPTGNTEQFPWVYYPIVTPASEHAIVNNLNEILLKYAGSIDVTNASSALTITPLLYTSAYGRSEAVPLLIKLSNAAIPIDRNLFNKKNITTGILIEGDFKSIYADRVPEEIKSINVPILPKSVRKGKIALFSDGDIFLNEVSQQKGPMEMGQYLFSAYKFNNKNLMMNTIEYLTDSTHLLDIRNKNYEASLLDHKRVQDEREMWQLINILIPTVIVIIFGLLYYQLRKRKYGKKQ